MVISLSVNGQVDSTSVIVADSNAVVIGDTTGVDSVDGKKRRSIFSNLGGRPPYDPNVALKRSAIFPGWGQMYNRGWWKLPIIYGAFGGLTIAAINENKKYKEFRVAYLARTDDDPNTVDTMFNAFTTDAAIRNARNLHRRNRDFMFIIMTGVYALTLIEAYVDAHLRGFDVSEDLTMQVYPSMMGLKPEDQTVNFIPGAVLKFKF